MDANAGVSKGSSDSTRHPTTMPTPNIAPPWLDYPPDNQSLYSNMKVEVDYALREYSRTALPPNVCNSAASPVNSPQYGQF